MQPVKQIIFVVILVAYRTDVLIYNANKEYPLGLFFYIDIENQSYFFPTILRYSQTCIAFLATKHLFMTKALGII